MPKSIYLLASEPSYYPSAAAQFLNDNIDEPFDAYMSPDLLPIWEGMCHYYLRKHGERYVDRRLSKEWVDSFYMFMRMDAKMHNNNRPVVLLASKEVILILLKYCNVDCEVKINEPLRIRYVESGFRRVDDVDPESCSWIWMACVGFALGILLQLTR